MPSDLLAHLSPSNRDLVLDRWRFNREIRHDWDLAIFRPCSVRLLLVTDRLSFSPTDDFGLGTFVKVLLDTNLWGRVRITLANIGSWHPIHFDPSLTAESRISARIENFRFDNAGHFDPGKFDAVFLFGITGVYSAGVRSGGTLDDSEIEVLNAFQNDGGGVFATGDHGNLGFGLCSKVARARDMRYWTDYPGPGNAVNEVSMTGPLRNDTNVFNAGSNVFDDQSDDVPQTIVPRYYTRTTGIFRYRYPHPLLCGPKGVIKVMPDHPHEGECKTPASLDETILVDGSSVAEYPAAVDGGARPVPEIISWNHVPAGRVSGSKSSTTAHDFPGICAYDGHRAGVGRVVTDATWHHFVNVNLVGIDGVEPPAPFALGFLGSTAGQAVFEEIKAYFRNLMQWLSRPQTISCLRHRWLVTLLLKERVLEAVLTARDIPLQRLSPRVLSIIGIHARDVLGRYAGRCQSFELILDLIEVEWRRFVDPWIPLPPQGGRKSSKKEEQEQGQEDLQLIDLAPMLDAALGGALVAISNELFAEETDRLEKVSDEELAAVARRGAAAALDKSRDSLERAMSATRSSPAFGRRSKGAD